MPQLRRHVSLILCLILLAGAAQFAFAAEDASAKLAFAPVGQEFHFDTGVLRGTLRAGGKSRGLGPIFHTATGAQLAGMFGLFSPYRLLTSEARFGTAGWDWASTAKGHADGAVEVQWKADAVHPLNMTGVYRWSAPDTLDLQFTVQPQRDLPKFELFLASYFNGFPAALAYVGELPDAKGQPGFMDAIKANGDWQTFPRDAQAAALFGDGRWVHPPNPVAWKIMPRLAAMLALRRDAKSGVTAVLMASPEDCFAISMPEEQDVHRSVYLSLFGRDLKKGEKASARARLVIGKDITNEKAVNLYKEYIRRGY